MFLTKEDEELTDEFIKKGYLIFPVADENSLSNINNKFFKFTKSYFKLNDVKSAEFLFNNLHKYLNIEHLNEFRLKLIYEINSSPDFKINYFNLARPYLEKLVGNELVMQTRVNLSIQIPNDDSSLLPVHADTWSGDSPFEVVVWVPLVDCYKTKSMFILPPNKNKKLNENFKISAGESSETLFNNISKDLEWIDIKKGHLLIFNQSLPHGNRVNEEKETRWSMNCRFKSIFTPYGDKKLGEFFEPITLRAASKLGMDYKYPKLK
jgi:sporadic carbohydrate cluster 2OG-Fe(II) oxygenase